MYCCIFELESASMEYMNPLGEVREAARLWRNSQLAKFRLKSDFKM